MNTEIKENPEEPGSYDLYLNGNPIILKESFSVCSEIEHSINSNHNTENKTEYDEIADSILARHADELLGTSE